MNILCPKCWCEIPASLVMCPSCGTTVDLYSRKYEQCLISALPSSNANRRAQICLVLALRGKRSSVSALLDLLHDPDILVRLAAVRSLGEIGDPSAIPGIERLTTCDQEALRSVAKRVLTVLVGQAATPRHRQVS